MRIILNDRIKSTDLMTECTLTAINPSVFVLDVFVHS